MNESNDEKNQNKKRKRTISNGSSHSTSKASDETKRTKLKDSSNKSFEKKSPGKPKKTNSTKNKSIKKSKDTLRKKNTLNAVLEASLVWETIEQIFFWQLLMAHDDIDVDCMLPLLDKLDSNNHDEAIFNVFQMLKSSEPTYDLVKFICRRRIDENMERALFIHWTRRATSGEIKMSQIFSKLLNKSALSQTTQQSTTLKKIKYIESFTNNKKLTAEQQLEIASQQRSARAGCNKQNSISSNLMDKDQIPTLDQVLFYLNKLRTNNYCINFILKENLLENLQKVYRKYCDDELKKKYADLFTLSDEFEVESDDNEENDNYESDPEEAENSYSNKKKTSKSLKNNKTGQTLKGNTNKHNIKQSSSGGNKRSIRVTNSKLPNKKIKLRSQNSSEERELAVGDENNTNNSQTDESDENDENSDSNSSAENKVFTKKKK